MGSFAWLPEVILLYWAHLLMTGLIIKVSGVALLEKTLKSKKPGYEEYVRKTSAFFPWFPEKITICKQADKTNEKVPLFAVTCAIHSYYRYCTNSTRTTI